MTDKELLELAESARASSYCPYSGIAVGAALLTRSGKVYLGANIENAAYSPSVCAERVALFKAVSEGERDFAAIAVSGGKRDEAPSESFAPCGVCRQAMAEFCSPDFRIIFNTGTASTLSELLPYTFDKESLK